MEIKRTSKDFGNVLLPIDEQEELLRGAMDVQTEFLRIFTHVSNQIYELHRSISGWEGENLMRDEGGIVIIPGESPEKSR